MTQPSASLDDRLVQAMRAFDPSEAQTKRMRHAVLASHDTLHRPLTLEWIAVFRTRPVLNTTLVMAAAILLLITSPLGSAGWFAWKTLVAAAQADGGHARIGLVSGGAHVETQSAMYRVSLLHGPQIPDITSSEP